MRYFQIFLIGLISAFLAPGGSSEPLVPRHSVEVQTMMSDMARIPACGTPLVSATHSKRDSSYTRNWEHADWEVQLVSPLVRYGRHVRGWVRSPTAVAVIPMVLAVAIWSSLALLMDKAVPSWTAFLKASSFSSAVGGLSAPVALLLTLRTNRALDRLLEARQAWGVLIKSSTSLASLVATHVMPRDSYVALLVARYAAILGWSFKGFFMREDDRSVIALALPETEARWLGQSPLDTPTSIVLRIRTLVASLDLPTSQGMTIDARLAEIEGSLGVCKRILGSPIPPTFSRHMSRALFLYLTLLPMGLVGAGVPPKAVILSSALIAYVLVGIDEIGIEIEHPFRLLPLCSLSTMLQRNVVNMFASYDSLPNPSGSGLAGAPAT